MKMQRSVLCLQKQIIKFFHANPRMVEEKNTENLHSFARTRCLGVVEQTSNPVI